MFGLFGGKDWNIIAVLFERADLYTVTGQRAKGGGAVKSRDGASAHARTIYWAVFDQKGVLKESGEGPGGRSVPAENIKRLEKELRTNRSVQEILKALETGQAEKFAKPLVWGGYPRKPVLPKEEEFE
jgi:hypothetical protein